MEARFVLKPIAADAPEDTGEGVARMNGEVLANQCKKHAMTCILSSDLGFFPVSCEKNVASPNAACLREPPPVPPHVNVGGYAPEPLDDFGRFFRNADGPPQMPTQQH